VFFAVGSSAVVSVQTKPAFVLVWLLSFYVVLALAETLVSIPRRRREAATRPSIPPT
jgi:CDP-diacylglycerol--serine O-phosphatidyltransferase